jgi:hypothetical protein
MAPGAFAAAWIRNVLAIPLMIIMMILMRGL